MFLLKKMTGGGPEKHAVLLLEVISKIILNSTYSVCVMSEEISIHLFVNRTSSDLLYESQNGCVFSENGTLNLNTTLKNSLCCFACIIWKVCRIYF